VVEADGHALQRVLVNLLDNAIKHSPEGSAVVVGLEFEAQRVLLWVEDDGPGIPRAEQERIFEKFYRIGSELRRQTQGVGLGLSIVKHLAEVHGGRVLVHSNLGEGSRFTVELPLRTRTSISTQAPNESQITP
jgi:two-component system phosphate regulon sensor histidine kinase PhoR